MSALTHCPSAQPETDNAVIIGVVHRDQSQARVDLLPEAIDPKSLVGLVPDELRPTEVFRFAAPCAEGGCVHFDGGACQLASRISEQLPVVAERLRPCAIRSTCRWFRQERGAACRRCPQVITEPYRTTPLIEAVASPSQPTNKEHAPHAL